MKGGFIPAPAPWPRTRRYLGFGGVSSSAETSLPGSASNRRCFGLGIARDSSRSASQRPHPSNSGKDGPPEKSKAGAPLEFGSVLVWGWRMDDGTGVCGFEPYGLRRVDYVQGISGADHLRFFEPGGVAEILSRRDQLSDWAHRHDREYGDVYRYAVSPV